MIYAAQDDVRIRARRLNIEIAYIQEALQDIGHFDLDIAHVLVFGLYTRLVKDHEAALNIDDTPVGQDIDIIDIIRVYKGQRSQETQHQNPHEYIPCHHGPASNGE